MAAISYNLQTADGRDIDALIQMVELRKKELGETTSQACTAIAINCLKSLRADTKVAKETGIKVTVKDVTSQYYPSWRTQGKFHVRVFRNGKNGNIVKPESNIKVQWCISEREIEAGASCFTYLVTDNIADNKRLQLLIVAKSSKDAENIMKTIHKKRVKHYKGLAKLSLGMAMHKVSEQQKLSDSGTNAITKSVADKSVKVKTSETGFNNGDVSIRIEDNLDYASDALKSGANYVDIAMRKALNKMTGDIIHRMKTNGNSLADSLEIPFPELRGQ